MWVEPTSLVPPAPMNKTRKLMVYVAAAIVCGVNIPPLMVYVAGAGRPARADEVTVIRLHGDGALLPTVPIEYLDGEGPAGEPRPKERVMVLLNTQREEWAARITLLVMVCAFFFRRHLGGPEPGSAGGKAEPTARAA